MKSFLTKILQSKWKRRIVWMVLASVLAVVLFGVFLVLVAIRLPSRQMRVEAVQLQSFDSNLLSDRLASLIRVPSYSLYDRSGMNAELFQQIHQLLQEQYPNAAKALHREIINEMSVLYRWDGVDQSAQPILLMSHIDVVPIESDTQIDWSFPPHDGTVSDGYLWGRGALDVKCGVVGIMSAAEALIESGFQPQQTIYFAFGHDEEIGGTQGNKAIAELLKSRGIRLSFVLDEGGVILNGVISQSPKPIAFIAIAEKQWASLNLTAYGEGGHSSMPGRSALVNMAAIISRLEENPMPVRITDATGTLFDFLGPELPLFPRVVMGNRWLFDGVIGWQFSEAPSTNAVVRSILNVTQLNTESVPNQTPSVAHATINVRLLPGDTAEAARDHVMKLGEDLRKHDGSPAIVCEVGDVPKKSAVASIDAAGFHTLQKSIHEVFPDVIVAAGLTSVSTDSSWYHDVADNIYRFIPMRLTPVDLQRIHGTNERIGVENLKEISQFYVRLIANFGGQN